MFYELLMVLMCLVAIVCTLKVICMVISLLHGKSIGKKKCQPLARDIKNVDNPYDVNTIDKTLTVQQQERKHEETQKQNSNGTRMDKWKSE
eukprot:TRINITY_DN6233_c0_g1_i1.p1 TRINITY_DN6233_c0_g1~~TRINITY_DN6233_c0_g1_i1.p1  ORF type:complete len:91 (+),score=17.75 TRINITY_DN6233_c0_g1_i1:172-444(+)